jgi:hypothetical protein
MVCFLVYLSTLMEIVSVVVALGANSSSAASAAEKDAAGIEERNPQPLESFTLHGTATQVGAHMTREANRVPLTPLQIALKLLVHNTLAAW